MTARSGEKGKTRGRAVSASSADLDALNSPHARGEVSDEGAVDLSGRNDSLYRHRFTVLHPFPWKDVWYTRENADQIADLPAEIIEAKIADGSIVDNEATQGE